MTWTGRWAEGEGFEPPDAFASLAFKASAIGRSANPPGVVILPYPGTQITTCWLSGVIPPANSHVVRRKVGGEPLEPLGK